MAYFICFVELVAYNLYTKTCHQVACHELDNKIINIRKPLLLMIALKWQPKANIRNIYILMRMAFRIILKWKGDSHVFKHIYFIHHDHLNWAILTVSEVVGLP